jgi:cytoskeletal protein CcmA (bactofilin family)
MFSKPAKASTGRSETPDGAALRRALPASLVGENVGIKGDLTSDGDIQLDGSVHGDLKVGHLTIGESGKVLGVIEADVVDVRGQVAGSITARQVRLYGSAQVEGDITHAELTIDAGARFQGRSIRFEAAPAPAVLSVPSAA